MMRTEPIDVSRAPAPMPRSFLRRAMALAGLGLVLVALAAVFDWRRALGDWLAMVVFLTTVGTGALFVVALEYAVNAVWSVPFRRIAEHIAALIPVSAVLFLPVLIGMPALFEWTHADVIADDPIIRAKTPYLNIPFFVIRYALYFAIWIGAWRIFAGNSRRQDATGEGALTRRLMRLSPVYMILFAFTITFAAFDWVMSLMPHWYSTMMGVYLGIGAIVAGLAATTLVATQARLAGLLPRVIRPDHFYNLGALMFAMNVFWAYVAFSQFMLIWYGNLPVETAWYAPRGANGWYWISIYLIFGHFGVPFFALLSRQAKMDLRRLRWVAIWLLASHAIDVYWLTVPSIRPDDAFSWHEIGFPVLAAGIGMLVWDRMTARTPIVPVRDPRLESALAFHL